MKNNFFLGLALATVVISAIFWSCSNDNDQSNTTNFEQTDLSQMTPKNLSHSDTIIGYIDTNGIFQLTADKNEILSNWNYNLKELVGIDAFLNDIEVIKIDTDDYFLKGTGTSDWGASMSLHFNLNNSNISLSKVNCTSKACATSETGCVPRKSQKSCTPCNGGISDCTKTVTSASMGVAELDSSYVL